MKTNSLDFDAQALREKILDLAMRGKLVNQDPNDEPANVLLEKIKAEKVELVKEGKIKKSKALPEITEDEKPFDIPDSWEWVRLGDVLLNTIGGGTPSKKNQDYWNGKIPWISVKDVHKDELEITETQDTISTMGLKNSSTNLIKANTLIAVMRMAVGRIGVVKMNACINQDLRALITSKNFCDQYLLYIYSHLNFETSGITVKGLKINALLETIIPLPPLSEQSRIAAKIAQLFALLRKVESSTQQYAKLQTLLRSKVLDLAMRGKLVEQDPNDEPASVLLEKIKAEKEQLIKEKKMKKSKPLPQISDEEKPFEIPDSWEWVRLGDVGLIATGNTPTKNNSDFYGGATPFIKPADIQNLIINYNTKDFLSEKGEQKGRLAYKNDILVTCIGNLGRNNIINRKVAYNQQINGISPLIVSSSLLHYFMLSSFFISSMYNYASATTLPILNKTKLSNLIIPLPPLAEQSGIVDKIEMIFSLFCKDESSTQQYENL